jgi:hypothetical protein
MTIKEDFGKYQFYQFSQSLNLMGVIGVRDEEGTSTTFAGFGERKEGDRSSGLLIKYDKQARTLKQVPISNCGLQEIQQLGSVVTTGGWDNDAGDGYDAKELLYRKI